MTWARAALVCGVLVLLATFGIGTENELSTSVMGQDQHCGSSIPASWLMSGTGDQPPLVSEPTADQERAARACEPVVRESRMLLLTMTGAGGVLALIGWTALSSRREDAPRAMTHARA